MRRLTGLVVCAVFFNIGVALAAESPSLEKGQQLFTSETVGTSGRSCATCHPDGQKLKGVGSSDDNELAETVNRCITGPLEGKRLDPESSDMKSLVLYLKSLATPDK